MDDTQFQKHYKVLNAKQREAVDTIEGPVMVVAGPGTGKTQILTLRIANIIKTTDTPPDAILALTFTEAGVAAMRKRLHAMMGVTAYRVPIFTFHGFCNDVLQKYSSHFPEILGSRVASELDRITIMQQVFDEAELEHLASLRSKYHYVEKTLRAISLLKRELIGPEELQRRLQQELIEIRSASDYRHEKGAHKGKVKGEYLKREEEIAKNNELAILYERYNQALAASELYDFDDMLLSVVRKLESDETLRLILQEEYQYLLADEHQDANGVQNRVLELLASYHDSPNLFIVGDDKQAIYRFQGASLENFLYFRRRFPAAKLITLTDNYRSTQTVLDSAHKLITWSPGDQVGDTSLDPCPTGRRAGLRRDDKSSARLMARAGHEEVKIAVCSYPGVQEEASALAQDVKHKIADGVSAEEIAIFVRTNAELATYHSALTRADLPVALHAKSDVLEDEHIIKLLTLLNATIAVGKDGPLVAALHLDCFTIPELEIFELAREAVRRRVSIWTLLARQSSARSDLIVRSDLAELSRVAGMIQRWAKVGANASLTTLVSTVAQESGWLAQVLAVPNAEQKLRKFEVLLEYLESYTRTHRNARINTLATILALLDEYDVLETKITEPTVGKVQLMTAHKAKGLEFDHVYIVGCTEGNWSGGRIRSDFKIPGLVAVSKEDEEADDRRLFFVALTRARKQLALSYSLTRSDGTSLFPSRFLEDLPNELLEVNERKQQESVAERALRLAPATLQPKSPEALKAFIRETLLERGLAVTGLNNYLSCPWKYFYRTLLRVPEPQTVPLMFGNAVHRTLRAYFDGYAIKEEMEKEQLLIRLVQELEREAFTDQELRRAMTDGKKALGGYYDRYVGTWPRAIKNEFAVDKLFPVEDFELRLTGKLDKLEFTSEDRVTVVDYKTGQPKSRNEIEGKTRDADGDYKRQLVFYKLLLEHAGKVEPYGKVQPCRGYRMETGVIDFVVPNKSGKYVREEFVVNDAEVAEVCGQIKRMVQELTTLSFWGRRCEDNACVYCRLRRPFQA